MPTSEKSIKLLDHYLTKHQPRFRIEHPPSEDVGVIVVIPAYREGELLFQTLSSLLKCDAPESSVEVIIVLNSSEADNPAVIKEQESSRKNITNFIEQGLPPWLTIYALEAYNLRKKHFGAGLARKTGLDEATRRFLKIEDPEGILVCLDADSPVASNYFTAIEKWFSNTDHQGAIVHFEHPTEGKAFAPQIYEAIVLYELHLRYYRLALQQAGFPYSFHTMGSCMAFRAIKYVQSGGMSKKQAGEDFYFLQKLIPLGGFGEIKNTTVFPSPRPSYRVIFGTGASIQQHVDGTRKQGNTYNPKAFEDMKGFFSRAEELSDLSPENFEEWTYQLTGPLRSFLLNTDFKEELLNIQQNSNSKKTFVKRFFGVFNAFRVIKYLNYAHDHFYSRTSVFDAAITELGKTGEDTSDIIDENELLMKYREVERR